MPSATTTIAIATPAMSARIRKTMIQSTGRKGLPICMNFMCGIGEALSRHGNLVRTLYDLVNLGQQIFERSHVGGELTDVKAHTVSCCQFDMLMTEIATWPK